MSIKLLVVAPLIMASGAPGLHLGQSPDAIDAVPAAVVLDSDSPQVAVRVTNRTGQPARLSGWLNGFEAVTEVPQRSAIVTLSWPAAAEGRSRLTLWLGEPGNRDVEVHDVLIRPSSYGPRHDAADAGLARVAAADAPGNSPVNAAALPLTGQPVRPYVVLGAGMLGFGLAVLGLAWILGRRSPSD